MSVEMDALVETVTAAVGVEDSATAFLTALVPMLQDVAGDKAKTLELAADIKAHNDALAAALAANQPPA